MNLLMHNLHHKNISQRDVLCCLSVEFKKRGKPQQRLS